MSHHAETNVIPPTNQPVARSPAAERMRRHRERRRDGFRCLTIELHVTEIDILIQKGFLQSVARNNVDAVRQALYSHLWNKATGVAFGAAFRRDLPRPCLLGQSHVPLAREMRFAFDLYADQVVV